MSKRQDQRGAVMFGLAGGMLLVAAGLAGGYYVAGTRSEARAATAKPADAKSDRAVAAAPGKATPALEALLGKQVQIKTGGGTTSLTWAELGVEVDPDELGRAGSIGSASELAALGTKGSIPLRLDRAKGVQALLQLKAKF